MAHRLVRAGIALAATAVLTLPTAAFADGDHDHAPPSADPHAGHADHDDHAGADSHDQDEDGGAGTAHDHGVAPSPQGHDDHDDHAPEPGTTEESHDHGATNEDDAVHTDHGTAPDSVSPEVRNLVLSGFAGVNAAVIFGAWMVRRTGPDPDPRKRAPKASR